jgi:protein gp37
MKRAEWHRFMSLTKHPERMRELLNGKLAWMGDLDHAEWGTSIGTRETLYRLDVLRDTNARVRFLSLEPLLEDLGDADFRGIDQVIVGCESGKGARRMDEDWARRIRDQAKAASAAFFYKQRLENGHKVETPELDGQRWTEHARPLGWGSTRPAPKPPAARREVEERDEVDYLFR